MLRVRTYRHHETNDKPDDSQHHDDECDDPNAPGVGDLIVQPVILIPTDTMSQPLNKLPQQRTSNIKRNDTQAETSGCNATYLADVGEPQALDQTYW